MKAYFEEGHHISGTGDEVLRTIAGRYMKANPALPFSYRAFSDKGFERGADGRCILDFDKKFPEAENGDYAFAFAKFQSRTTRNLVLAITVHNPMELFVNGAKITQTSIYDEVIYDKRLVEIPVNQGDNTIFIKCRKNVLGFQCVIGSSRNKWDPVNFYTAFAENEGELGWNYCGVFKEDIFAEIPQIGAPMEGIWLPRPYTNGLPAETGHSKMYAVSVLACRREGEVAISLGAAAKMEFYLDGELIAAGQESIHINISLKEGTYNVAVLLYDIQQGCRLDCSVENAGLTLPECVKDMKGCWLYLDSADENAKQGFEMFTLYDAFAPGEKVFYKCGKDTYLRPVLEEALFGKSNYPIGVVLYGLLKTGEYLKDTEILSYAQEHLRNCYKAMEYSLWDEKQFGYPCINHQLIGLAALDDCGSFASAALEDYIHHNHDEAVLSFAEYVADYILQKQERLKNGMFYREKVGHLHQNTIWADDLYMSTPFIIRYAQIKDDTAVLDDAVNQFLCFKEKLFMEESQLMSHVYNLKYDLPTRIPWGRGNGWVLFSLSELLMVIPKEHKDYEEIREFFVQLSQGFLEQIDEVGMLHQVLWDHESYAEASCTAMCAAAFARGVRLGLLSEEIYKTASEKCVEALKKYCVDEEGNVYGVCCGSGYSFREEYYKYELPWVLNDTHGTGIVLLAMVEVEKNRAAGNVES